MNYKAVFLFPIEYLLIVGYVIIVIWTCVEQKESAPIDYGLLANNKST